MTRKRKPLLPVTIKRSLWLHNTKAECPARYSPYLLAKSGKMCCLGFVARASGLTQQQIRHKALPDSVPLDERKGPFAKLVRDEHNTPTCCSLARENDTPHDPTKQESNIIRLMRRIGVKARFVD